SRHGYPSRILALQAVTRKWSKVQSRPAEQLPVAHQADRLAILADRGAKPRRLGPVRVVQPNPRRIAGCAPFLLGILPIVAQDRSARTAPPVQRERRERRSLHRIDDLVPVPAIEAVDRAEKLQRSRRPAKPEFRRLAVSC